MKNILIIAGIIISSISFAGDDHECMPNKMVMLSVEEVKAELSKQGYSSFTEVEHNDCFYEVKAKNKSNDKVELKFDPTSKKVISEEKDN